MKYFYITILLLTSSNLFACLSASQNRLYPLGTTSKGLCVIETHLKRTELKSNDLKFIPGWAGLSYFKIYDKNYKAIYTEILDTFKLFNQVYYDSFITKSFLKGYKLANKYDDFIAAKPISILFCDYQESCSKAKILFDTIKNTISIQLPNKNNHILAVLSDTTSIASNLLDYYNGFDDAEISAKAFLGMLQISSVRQFQLGNQKLTIVHIGYGEILEPEEGKNYPKPQEYQAKFEFTDILKSVFFEPVLHHGHGFDFYIWE